VQSSRRLEREAGRSVEVMWLTGRLAPDQRDAFGGVAGRLCKLIADETEKWGKVVKFAGIKPE
jgi:hypothetical protein